MKKNVFTLILVCGMSFSVWVQALMCTETHVESIDFEIISQVVAVDDTLSLTEGTSWSLTVIINDSLSWVLLTPSSSTSTLTWSNPLTWSYLSGGIFTIPAGNNAGTYTIPYRVCDATNPVNCDEARISVTITPKPVIPIPPPSIPSIPQSWGGWGSPIIPPLTASLPIIPWWIVSPKDAPLAGLKSLKNVDPNIFNPDFKTQCKSVRDITTIDQWNMVTTFFKIAHQFIYSYGLSSVRGTRDYQPERPITRQEMARFSVEFAINVLCRKPTYTYTHQFTDLGNADPTLEPFIKKSYEYVIFHGDNGWASKGIPTTFRPNDPITTDELISILVRLVTNTFKEWEWELWAEKYKQFLKNNVRIPLYSTERWSTAQIIYDLYKSNPYILKEVGYVIDKPF